MRWPFGPPHLTLKPSKKTKQQKQQKNLKKKKTKEKTKQTKTKAKQEPTPKTIQQQNKNKANKTATKATQKTKTNTRNTKNLNLPKPKINKNKPPPKAQKLGKKQAFLTLLELCQTHQKQTTITLKPQKKTNPKHHFAMFKSNPLFFIIFCFFLTYRFCFWKAVFAENTIKIVFSEKNTAFKKTQLVKPIFRPCQKTLFSKKRCHFWFWAISAETTFFFLVCTVLVQETFLAKSDSVHENARFYSPFLTQIVSGNFC